MKLDGLPALKAALAAKAAELHAAAVEAVAQETETVRDDARLRAPRGKTGDLRRGIRGEPVELVGEVKSTVRYAAFVEHGTYRNEAQPYMRPAADKARRRFPDVARDVIRRALGE